MSNDNKALLVMFIVVVTVFILLTVIPFKKFVKQPHTYETDDTQFYNGEILYPDHVHTDTLIVTDAPFINKWMRDYDAASDGDIYDILRVSTNKYIKE